MMSNGDSVATPKQAESAEDATVGDGESEDSSDRRKRRVELVAAIIIGFAAVLTALATFQGSQVDGTVQNKSTAAVGLTLQANDIFNEATAEQAQERDWFFGFLTAAVNGEEETSDVLLRAMPVEVQVLTIDWFTVNEQRLDDPNEAIDDPFFVDADGVPAVVSFLELPSTVLQFNGSELDALAACALFDSQVAEIRGDNYGLSTVFLAIALVVGGIAALLNRKAAQVIVLVTSIVSLVLGASVLALAADQDSARQEAATEFFRDDNGDQLLDADALTQANEHCPQSS